MYHRPGGAEMNNEFRTIGAGASIVKQGALFMILGPKQIYDFFDKGARYHVLQYVAILASVVSLYICGEAWIKHGAMVMLPALAFSALSVGGLALVASLVEKLGGWFAWYPGLGYKTRTGAFKPLFGEFGKRPAIKAGDGAAKADETLLRGAAVVDGAALASAMKQGANEEDLAHLIHLGGVPVPYRSEAAHFLIEGRTGGGKSQAINSMLRVVRKRNQSAVVADPAGGFMARFWREGDVMLNPFDARSQHWSPFAEIRYDYDCQRIAKAAIPDAEGESQEWHFYAQSLFAEVMRAMHKAGQRSIKQLLHYVMAADSGELAELLAGTPAAILTKRGNDKMLSNTRAIASLYLNVWTYLKDEGTFSVSEWVRRSDTNGGQFLYLAYRDNQLAMLRNLVATWLELAIVEGLSLNESHQRRLWYVMDELDSLGKITSLRAGLTKLRKYGGVCVSGLQTVAQLRTTYGRDEAQTLLSCMSTKLIMGAGDGETAQYFEDEIGKQEVERREVSNSTNSRPGELPSSSENISTRRTEQSAVLASEIQGLPDLHGFLKLIGMPVARVYIEPMTMPNVVPPFIAQE